MAFSDLSACWGAPDGISLETPKGPQEGALPTLRFWWGKPDAHAHCLDFVKLGENRFQARVDGACRGKPGPLPARVFDWKRVTGPLLAREEFRPLRKLLPVFVGDAKLCWDAFRVIPPGEAHKLLPWVCY